MSEIILAIKQQDGLVILKWRHDAGRGGVVCVRATLHICPLAPINHLHLNLLRHAGVVREKLAFKSRDSALQML